MKEKNYHFISRSEICEIWWLHFKTSVVQIDQLPAPLKPPDVDYLHSAGQMLHSERQCQKPSEEKVEVKHLPTQL